MEDKLILNAYPATCWREATPIGNGRLGGAVYGAVYDERILINEENLYNNPVNREIPDISAELSAVRMLMDEKRYAEADEYYVNVLKDKGYYAKKGYYYPAFDLHFLMQTDCAFTDYTRALNMHSGICTVSYKEDGKTVTRESFVSYNDGYLVLHLTKEIPFECVFSLEEHDIDDMVDSAGGFLNLENEFSSISEDRYIYSRCKTKGGLDYSGFFKVVSTDGVITFNGRDKKRKIDMQGTQTLANYVKVSGATHITAILFVSHVAQPFEDMRATADGVNKDYLQMKEEQQATFSEIFDRVEIELCKGDKAISNEQLLLDAYNGKVGNLLIEKMADYGRYLLIASSCGGKLPANLQGIWNGDYSPAWECTFFNNENIEMEYWQALTGNLKEAVLPLFDLYDRFKDDYRQNAKKLYGCRGLLLPLFMDNQSGKKDNLQPHVLYWTGSSAWVAALYYDYYLFTGDNKFLLERAYPFMKESALFYEDFLVLGEDGYLKSYPSNSPENRANGQFKGAGEVSVCINATMDFALIKELLTNLVAVSKENGFDLDKRAEWADMLEKIPQYEINEDGALKEWLHADFKDNYQHRHQSHIYPLFPGLEVTEESDATLYKAILTAVEKRLNIGLKDQTGWSFAHMANIFARLNNGEKAKECLNFLIRFCTGSNLYTYHNDWRNMGVTLKYMTARHAPFQIDANMGFTAAIYEMIMYSNAKMLKFLPALAKEFEEGRAKGLCARGGLISNIEWNKKQAKIQITATRNVSVDIGVKNGTIISATCSYKKSLINENYIFVEFNKGDFVELVFDRCGN